MEKLQDYDRLESIFSHDRIAHINAIGVRELCDDFEVYVDDREEIKSYVMTKKQWYIVNSLDDREALDSAERMIDDILNAGEARFSGVRDRYFEMVRDRSGIEFYERCYLYYLPPENFTYEEPDQEITSLREEEAEIVARYHPYSSEDEKDSVSRIRRMIKNYPAYTIRDEDDQPVSWALLRDDGSLGMAHTLKEHRRKGLAAAITVELLKETIEMGLIPYVHIVTDNSPSISLAEDLGFKRFQDEVVWFGTE